MTEIQIRNIGVLDVVDDLSIPLNFTIAEIKDISKRSGSYSKTITLPGNKNNNKLLGNLFNINISDATFNINEKIDVIILQDKTPVFEGVLQLLNVNKISPTLVNGDEQIEYEVIIKNDAGDFYSSMDEKLLTDLTGWDQYDHDYTIQNIMSTSANTSSDIYKYFMAYNLRTYYTVEDFQPALFAKSYWDRIFFESGYSYSWNNLSNTNFDKLIIPFNGSKAIKDVVPTIVTFNPVVSDTVSNVGGVNIVLFNYNNIVTDVDNNYNTTTRKYTVTTPGLIDVKNKFSYTLSLDAPQNMKLLTAPNGTAGEIEIIVESSYKYVRGVSSFFFNMGQASLFDYNNTSLLQLTTGITALKSGITNEANATQLVENGDVIEANIRITVNYTGQWYQLDNVTPITLANYPEIRIDYGVNNVNNVNINYLDIRPQNPLTENSLVQLKNFIPQKIKQKDFIAGIIKMFNLYITPDENNDKNLLVSTRDEFYDSGDVLDWTYKLDKSKDTKVVFIPDILSKKILFSYKADNDAANTEYTNRTSNIYGEFEIEFENEFVKDTNKVEPIFSPTPLIENGFGLIVPYIDSISPKNNIRILFSKPVNGIWEWRSTINPAITATYFNYSYAGHFNDPIENTIDFNFGICDEYLYSDWNYISNNNLFNKYYSRSINQIETGSLLTAFFRLTPADINKIKLNDKIFILDNYYYINRIIDYDANAINKLTKVELITVKDAVVFQASYLNNIATNDAGQGLVGLGLPSDNNTFGKVISNVTPLGQNNLIQSKSKNNLTLGDNNNIAGLNTFLLGNNNITNGVNNLIIGNNNTVTNNNKIILGGDNKTYTGDTTGIFMNYPVYVLENGIDIPLNTYITGLTPSFFTSGSSGNYSIKTNDGSFNDATNDYALAFGPNSLASGLASFASGLSTVASGDTSFAANAYTQANGLYSTAFGIFSIANGQDSFVTGHYNTADGINSAAIGGSGNTVTGNNSVVIGGTALSGSTDNTVYTSYLSPLLTTYANDDAADADTTLASGGLYKVTGSRVVYQKP